MNILEALNKIRYSVLLWARPVEWKGRGIAVSLNTDDNLVIVPSTSKRGPPWLNSPGGFSPWPMKASFILGEWEVVYPDDIWQERS